VHRAPLLVVEIRSPSTALIDLNHKKAAYERFGVPSYWIADLDVAHPSLTVFELAGDRYAEAANVTGDEPFSTRRPFPVWVVPAALVSGLR
jgi:Uma2 family endonuclease